MLSLNSNLCSVILRMSFFPQLSLNIHVSTLGSRGFLLPRRWYHAGSMLNSARINYYHHYYHHHYNYY